jgi:uncharacterized protein YlxP (DUF503 family)
MMVVGIGRITLRIPENSSLKGKRVVVKSIIGKVKSRFNVSIAEVDSNDLWQMIQLGMSHVGNDRRHINSCIDKVLNFVENLRLAEVIDREIEIINV